MYCSSCGVAVAKGLSYCNYCGAKLVGPRAGDAEDLSEIRHRSLVFGMLAVFVFGMVGIMGLMAVMKLALGLDDAPILAVTLLCFLIMIAIEAVFIRLLLRLHRVRDEAATAALSQHRATKEFEAAERRVLPEPVPSVTEGTTRAFEPLRNERTSK